MKEKTSHPMLFAGRVLEPLELRHTRMKTRLLVTTVSVFLSSSIIIVLLESVPSLSSLMRTLLELAFISLSSLSFIYIFLFRAAAQEIALSVRRESEVQLAFRVLESSSEAIVITDAGASIEYVNPAFCTITGYSTEELIGKNPSMMKSGKHNPQFYKDMWSSIRETGQWQGEVWDKKKNGDIYPKWLAISAITDEKEKVLKYVGVFSDITSLKQTEAHLEYLAHYDSLTNTPNRLLFRDRLKQSLRRAERAKRMVAVMMLDLNRFKHVNDTWGHLAGDELLRGFSDRLAACIRKEDTHARLGGDEFAIILDDLADQTGAEIVARKILDSLIAPFIIRGRPVYMSTSIGITIYPKDGEDIDILIRNADLSMYEAKDRGDNMMHFYEPKMGDKSFERLSIETNLRQAIEAEEFVLHYQPQVEVESGNIIGMEALIRRQQGDWLVPPGRFIPLAEDTGLIIPICEWTLKTGCRQAKKWIDEGLPPLRVAINLTATQLFSVKLIETVESVLAETGLEPRCLELELTERVIVRDSKTAIQLMRDLKNMGICLSIDDFGTGYSSLSYLNQFPIDKLKVDISFVRECTRDAGSASITKAIIALGHNLGLKVIAEGVETKEQLEFLREHGCDEIQGFYFSRPLPVEGFEQLVRSGRRLTA